MPSDILNDKLEFQDLNPDFIPYACHISDDIILTKNGNLIQTIKITGFAFELVGAKQVDLRTSIKNAISKHVNTDNFAIWLHTVRRKKDLSLEPNFKNNFCAHADSAWNSLHNWSNKYVNELYISILTESKVYRLTNFANILKCCSFLSLKNSEKKIIAKQKKLLNSLTNNFINDLKDFGARKLKISMVGGKYYSEQLRFFSKILNLKESDYEIKDEDLSYQLPKSKIVFGKNMFQIMRGNEINYASIFSIKDYGELSLKSLDKFLLAPFEFIMCQTIDFVNADTAKLDFIEQSDILEISGDSKFAKTSGIEEIIATNTDSPTSFGEHQLTLTLIDNNQESLEKSIRRVNDIFSNYGLVIIREDLFMENCFWSQLPGNFYYICRRRAINTRKFASFASLSNFPAGKRNDNKWGEAVSVFYTNHKTPYFFNFHCGDNGHSLIVGPEGTGKTVLLNFLLAQSTKFNPRIIYLDFFNSSEIFINALDGKYISLDRNSTENLFSPLSLFKNNPNFIQNFLSFLMIEKSETKSGKYIQEPNKNKIIRKIAEELATKEDLKFSDIQNYFKNSKYADFFSLWIKDGRLAKIFDNDNDVLKENNIIGFDLTDIANIKALLVPITYYIMNYLEKSLDGKPTILVIDEAFKILDNPFLNDFINDFLVRLSQNNCVAILATESLEDIKNSHITDLLIEKIATKIFLPNPNSGSDYQELFKLNNIEADLIKEISNDERKFMLKHGTDSLIAELDLADLTNIVTILSSNELTVKIMNKIKSKFGNNSENWLLPYQELVAELLQSDSYDLDSLNNNDENDDLENYNYENDVESRDYQDEEE